MGSMLPQIKYSIYLLPNRFQATLWLQYMYHKYEFFSN